MPNSTPSSLPSPGAMPADGPRARLARAQADLLNALVGSGKAPAGFVPERIRIVRQSLISKRLHAVARAWPALVRSLGDGFAPRFQDFAERTPPPAAGGALADGRTFAEELPAPEDAAAVLELLAVDLQYRQTPEGLVPRKGPRIAWRRLPAWQQLRIAWRVPLLGTGHLDLPHR